MPPRKTYEPHCPANDCSGGHAPRLHKVSAENVKITQEVLSRKKTEDEIYRCNYCGFVWFQSSSSRPGFDPTPAGFYGDFSNPDIFVAVAENYEIRRTNTPWYWTELRNKQMKRKKS